MISVQNTDPLYLSRQAATSICPGILAHLFSTTKCHREHAREALPGFFSPTFIYQQSLDLETTMALTGTYTCLVCGDTIQVVTDVADELNDHIAWHAAQTPDQTERTVLGPTFSQ